MKFGRLTVLRLAGRTKGSGLRTKGRKAIWLCQCECGNQKEVTGDNLYGKRVEGKSFTRSCGCLSRQLAAARMEKLHRGNRKADAAFNRVWAQYKAGARNRGIEFHLSKPSFRLTVTSPCFYCGTSPSNRAVSTAGGEFFYNGIDRVDSSRGYSDDNCVPCCKPCNWMKKDMSSSEFIRRILTIYQHFMERV